MEYLFLYNIDYAFRIKTISIFGQVRTCIFEIFVVDDAKFEQFYLF